MTRKSRQGASGFGAEAQGPKGLCSWCTAIHNVTSMPPLVTPKKTAVVPRLHEDKLYSEKKKIMLPLS